jgi:hypothetical protein
MDAVVWGAECSQLVVMTWVKDLLQAEEGAWTDACLPDKTVVLVCVSLSSPNGTVVLVCVSWVVCAKYKMADDTFRKRLPLADSVQVVLFDLSI